jgi:sporulation protein YlmC with PRC-barrel domain
MFITSRNICNVPVAACDGPAGRVGDLLFDDRSWRIRRLVVVSGRWLRRREVLVEPNDARFDAAARCVAVRHTAEEVRHGPNAMEELPVARRGQLESARLLAWDAYWTGIFDRELPGDPHLRDTQGITGHRIEGTDGLVGRVADFLIDTETWTIRYLIVETGTWRTRRRVMIEPRWVEWIRWGDRKVHVALTREMIEHSPELAESNSSVR